MRRWRLVVQRSGWLVGVYGVSLLLVRSVLPSLLLLPWESWAASVRPADRALTAQTKGVVGSEGQVRLGRRLMEWQLAE